MQFLQIKNSSIIEKIGIRYRRALCSLQNLMKGFDMISAKELAQEPTCIQITKNEYSEESQTRFQSEDCSSALTMTWNGTQTYDVSGKPWDNDNDR